MLFVGIVSGYSFDWCFCICGFAVFDTAVFSSFWDNVSMCLMQSCLLCSLYDGSSELSGWKVLVCWYRCVMTLYGKVLGFLMCMYQNILSFLDKNIICGRSLICNLLLVSLLIKV